MAEIDDDGLLGIDVLQNGSGGPADLMRSKGVLVVQDKEVSINQVGLKNRVRRVTAADHYVIPPQAETVIDVYVERYESDDFSFESTCLIEATEKFKETFPLKMAVTLVDVNKVCTCKVRVLNPFPTAISIKQDTTIGNAEPIDGILHVLFQQEDETEETNFHKVRRVNFASRTEAVKQEPEVEIARNLMEGQGKSIPDHLKDLVQRSTAELSDIEKEKVADLLGRYQDTFSCNEWDIGLTHLIEHAIKTEGKDPVRLPPRRVPLAHANKEKQAIEDTKAKGVIRERVSPWASPICLVSKKDGGVRLCVDYQKVNELVKPKGGTISALEERSHK